MRLRGAFIAATIGVAGLLALGAIGVALTRHAHRPKPPPRHWAYVWQQQWRSEVRDAVENSAAAMDGFMPLVATVTSRDGALKAQAVQVDWRTLGETGRPVCPVIRIEVGVAAILGRDPEGAAAFTSSMAKDLRTAAAPDVDLQGIQLDYDCPTARLHEYARFLKALRKDLPRLTLSITALPTWLRSDDMPRLLAQANHYVLQLHSLEKPGHLHDPVLLCDPQRLDEYLRLATAQGRPFYIALPTYSYRLYYDRQGEFVALAAEGAPAAAGGLTTREVHSDPNAIATMLRSLREKPPKHCLGFAWFRLPVHGDTMNWPWPVLKSVMQGHAPKPSVSAEMRNPADGLYELWLKTQGPAAPSARLQLSLDLSEAPVLAHDALGDFQALPTENGHWILEGPFPKDEAEQMAAWFRTGPALAGEHQPPTVRTVETTQ